MEENTTLARARITSARYRRLTTGLLVGLSALVVLERFSAVTVKLISEGFSEELARRLGLQLTAACPEVFYLIALWGIRQALAAIALGKPFAPAITNMLDLVGTMLAVGAVINVFVVPSVAWVLGFGPGYVIAYDISGLVLGAIGLSLKVLGHLLRHAGELQTELEEMF